MATTLYGGAGLPWTGNSALTGTRIASGDVLLDWNVHAVDAGVGTGGVWRMDEAAWAGVAGEVLDASANARHGQAFNAANTVAGWQNRAGNFPSATQAYVQVPAWTEDQHGTKTIEVWARHLGAQWWNILSWKNGLWKFSNPENGTAIKAEFWSTNKVYWSLSNSGFWNTTGAWTHYCCTFDNNTKTVRLWVNGVEVTYSQGSWSANDTPVENGVLWFGTGTAWTNVDMDDQRVSLTAIGTLPRYPAGNFSVSPYRYVSGNVVAIRPTSPRATVSQVEWAGTFGASYGTVNGIYLNTGTDASPTWTQVGGSNPTSPITGLTTVVQSGTVNWLKAILNPKADALQSETPTLDTLTLTYQVAVGAPRRGGWVRSGPILIPRH